MAEKTLYLAEVYEERIGSPGDTIYSCGYVILIGHPITDPVPSNLFEDTRPLAIRRRVGAVRFESIKSVVEIACDYARKYDCKRINDSEKGHKVLEFKDQINFHVAAVLREFGGKSILEDRL